MRYPNIKKYKGGNRHESTYEKNSSPYYHNGNCDFMDSWLWIFHLYNKAIVDVYSHRVCSNFGPYRSHDCHVCRKNE